MKVKINQDIEFWIEMLMTKFGLTRKEALNKIKPSIKKV